MDLDPDEARDRNMETGELSYAEEAPQGVSSSVLFGCWASDILL